MLEEKITELEPIRDMPVTFSDGSYGMLKLRWIKVEWHKHQQIVFGKLEEVVSGGLAVQFEIGGLKGNFTGKDAINFARLVQEKIAEMYDKNEKIS